MNNWTVRHRIAASFAAVILATLALGWIAYFQLRVIERAATAVQTHSLPGQRLIAEITIALVDNDNLVQEHIIRIEPAAMAALDEQIRRNWAKLEELGRAHDATVGSAEDRTLFEAFRSELEEYRRLQAGILRASAEARRDAAHTGILTDLDPVYERARAALDRLSLHDHAESDADLASILGVIDRTSTGILIGFIVAVAIALLAGALLLRAITQPLGRLVGIAQAMGSGDFTQRVPNDRGDEFGMLGRAFNRMTDDLTAIVGQVQQSTLQVNTSVTEIAATAREQQATASEIAATTTEIGATSREITATSKELARTMDEVATVAEQTASLAGTGQTGLGRMEETMRQVMEAVSSINAKLAVLNEKAGNINQVVTTITKVADQTNLLSLNAAIEAEKAGEYGRGFSVVATEIRRLADQTAVATYDIEQMVKEIQSAVSAGVMGMDKFSEEVRRGVQDIHQVGGQLSQIIQQVQTLAPRVESVNEGMNAQSTGAEQISQALTQLSEAAQQTVESLRQSNTAIEGLNQVSAGLRASVSQLKLNA